MDMSDEERDRSSSPIKSGGSMSSKRIKLDNDSLKVCSLTTDSNKHHSDQSIEFLYPLILGGKRQFKMSAPGL